MVYYSIVTDHANSGNGEF